jgi:hypothetical protein
MTTRENDTQAVELTIEEVYAAAEAEVEGLATETDAEPDSPVGEAQAEAEEAERLNEGSESDPEQADEPVDEFDFEDVGDVEEEDAPGALDLSTKVEVTGHGEVSIEELRNGYMMQADYTRSKQALKAEQEEWASKNEAAAKIMESLQDDPVGMAAYLAVETGLLTADQLDGKNIDHLRKLVTVPKAEELQAEIDRKVEERIAEDPRIQEAQASKVRAAIDAEFADIATDVGKPLSEKAKIEVIKYANEHDLIDLRVAFNALSAEAARRKARSEEVRKAATERPKTRGGKVVETKPDISNVEDAFELAMAQHDAG